MYRKTAGQPHFDIDECRTFDVTLDMENRWVKLSGLIPWTKLEEDYARLFKKKGGQKAYPLRVALGSLIIQAKLGITDEETVSQIAENPYMQYFLGFRYYQNKRPFSQAQMTYFRKRIPESFVMLANDLVATKASGPEIKAGQTHAGEMIIDATCAPADMRYPTDARLLNESREKLEDIIDTLHGPDVGKKKKPRTYRLKAKKIHVNLDKKRKKTKKIVRKTIRKQLSFVKRDLGIIREYLDIHPERSQLLSQKQKRDMQTIQTIYAQQQEMFLKKIHSVKDRIVSIHMPYVRPIVRGKAGSEIEFGAKILSTVVNGYSFIEKISFDAFNESTYLLQAVESYKARYGVYPEAVMADTIFRTRDNIKALKEKGIRISGPPLGRRQISLVKAMKLQAKIDAGVRNQVESSYGVMKRKYLLDKIAARLEETSKTCIALAFLVKNLDHRLRSLFVFFVKELFGQKFGHICALSRYRCGCLVPV